MWAILNACDANGLSVSIKTKNDYFRKITEEINQAFKDGRLKKEDNPASIFDKKVLQEFIKNFQEAFEYQVNLKEVDIQMRVDGVYIYNENPNLPKEREYEFKEITGNNSTNNLSYNYKADNIKFKILSIIKNFYGKLNKPLFFIGLAMYLLVILRFFLVKRRFENYKELIILTSFLLLFLIRLTVISYTTTVISPAIFYMYLSSTYSLMFGFEILSLIFGISELVKIIKGGFYDRKVKEI